MENFILYNAASEEREVTFEVSWVHVQRIAQGTDEMIAEMLGDLGVKDRKVQAWTLRHYLTNYLSDEPESDDWKVVWIETAAVTVTLDRPTRITTKDTELVHSYARDKTWKGKDLQKFPAECVVIADFYQDGALDAAQSRIAALAKKEKATVSFDQWASFPRKLKVRLGTFPKRFFLEGAPLAQRIMEICTEQGGSTNWNDRIAPEHMGS